MTLDDPEAVGINADDYAPDVWQEAVDRYEQLTPGELERLEEMVSLDSSLGPDATTALRLAFATVTMWDGLWAGLALLTAWGVGSGTRSD